MAFSPCEMSFLPLLRDQAGVSQLRHFLRCFDHHVDSKLQLLLQSLSVTPSVTGTLDISMLSHFAILGELHRHYRRV
jgi:hypothetical protein